MYADTVTIVFIHMIDQMVNWIMYVDFIYKENVVTVRDAGMKYTISRCEIISSWF